MKTHSILTLATLGALAASPLHGALVIEESFDYPAGNVAGNNGGTGFTGAWANTRNSPTAASPGLTWGSLGSGNYARGAAWSGLQRPLGTTSSLDNAGLKRFFGALNEFTTTGAAQMKL